MHCTYIHSVGIYIYSVHTYTVYVHIQCTYIYSFYTYTVHVYTYRVYILICLLFTFFTSNQIGSGSAVFLNWQVNNIIYKFIINTFTLAIISVQGSYTPTSGTLTNIPHSQSVWNCIGYSFCACFPFYRWRLCLQAACGSDVINPSESIFWQVSVQS